MGQGSAVSQFVPVAGVAALADIQSDPGILDRLPIVPLGRSVPLLTVPVT
jgi:hypothetical protein